MDITTIVIVSSIFFVLFLVVGKIALVKLMASSGNTASTPESVLKEVEIFLAYGKKEDAIACLVSALDAFPAHAALTDKLKELQ